MEKGGKNKKKGKKEEYKTMKGPLQCAPKTGPVKCTLVKKTSGIQTIVFAMFA